MTVMRTFTRSPLILLPLVVCLAGCDPDGASVDASAGARRSMLSEGYSLLYADAVKIDRLDLMLYVKSESEEFHDVITEISRFGDEFSRDLEGVAGKYPGVRIDLVPLPEMERRKRFALGKDRMLRFAPLAGRSRLEFERTVLIGMAGALDHERHLCRVMAQEEPDARLRRILLAAERRYDGLYELVMNLLNREHFKHNTNVSAGSPPGA